MTFSTIAMKRSVTSRSSSASDEAASLVSASENLALERHYLIVSNEQQIGFRMGGAHDFTIRFVPRVHKTDLGNAVP